CSVSMILLINLLRTPIIGFFTRQEEVVSLVKTLLLLSIYLEFGRAKNLIYIGALKGAGDIKFPVLYGMFSNWVIMVGGSYLLGLKLGLGVAGFWLGIGTDETTRGLVMLLRWKSKRWMQKSLV
ncbi:MAG: MATE family efflux transporter, partial [Treponema sp.]|nr:MATE family efflux transporter [Treponema sp.]